WPTLAKVLGANVGDAVVKKARAWFACGEDRVGAGNAARSEEVLPFPVEVFPAPLAAFITEAAASLPCPTDVVGIPALTVLSAAIGASRAMSVKGGWREGARIYSAVVADPGTKKSPALDFAITPMRERQRRLQDVYEEEKKAYEQELARYEFEMAAWKESVKK